MSQFIGYNMMSDVTKNSKDDGHLVKAQCNFCGAKYGSSEEAKKCESSHFTNFLNDFFKDWSKSHDN
jgi:hypothetical protein